MRLAAVRGLAVGLAAVLVGAFVTLDAHAQYRHRVVVVDVTDSDDATTLELLARVRGELSAAGFEIVDLQLTGKVEPKVAVETAATEYAPAAVLAVRHTPGATPGESIAELWVSDRLANRTLMQRARYEDRDTSSQTARLAVQVVELLKARLAALWVDAGTSERPEPKAAPPPPPEPAKPPPPPPEEPPPTKAPSNRFAVGAGLGVLRNFASGVDASWAPALRLGMSRRDMVQGLELGVRATAAMTPDTIELSYGQALARVRQAFILVEGYGRILPTSLVSPLLSVGLGAFTVNVAGEAPPPYSTHSDTTLSALSSVGGGFWIQPSNSVAWLIEGQLLAAWSETTVNVDSHAVGTVGWPMAFISTSILGVY